MTSRDYRQSTQSKLRPHSINPSLSSDTDSNSPSNSSDSLPPSRHEADSGWAMWVGNVPSEATSAELRAFFCRGCDVTIVSIRTIPHTKCAFINFSTEDQRQSAIARFNGVSLRRMGPPLVCRARDGSEREHTGVWAQRGKGMHQRWIEKHTGAKLMKEKTSSSESIQSDSSTSSSLLAEFFPERYFILKSLSQDDLDASVQRGIWATQPHNEDTLDLAFRTAKNVYLIFSVNRSREFYGCARMAGPIGAVANGDRVEWAPRRTSTHQNSNSSITQEPALLSSPTPHRSVSVGSLGLKFERLNTSDDAASTSDDTVTRRKTVPSRDSLRLRAIASGPIQALDLPYESGSVCSDDIVSQVDSGPASDHQNDWGREFRLEWLSTKRLPFRRVEHLYNPWNNGRCVKVSRDGTELEPGLLKSLGVVLSTSHVLLCRLGFVWYMDNGRLWTRYIPKLVVPRELEDKVMNSISLTI
ncbi:YTH domain-containing protein 1 [Mycena indigotica]|uniref:YTH domain-containing protein 1 n=1 Tax=Mycena indigotica TaxID=2126181 RepID=A0A8H6SRK3_9AGAR|nr:YTH domain-containing protein 1 [Mycena indigotica]KAF7303908.1 YTH domain-containing protein 1 [Mycena indigotica]